MVTAAEPAWASGLLCSRRPRPAQPPPLIGQYSVGGGWVARPEVGGACRPSGARGWKGLGFRDGRLGAWLGLKADGFPPPTKAASAALPLVVPSGIRVWQCEAPLAGRPSLGAHAWWSALGSSPPQGLRTSVPESLLRASSSPLVGALPAQNVFPLCLCLVSPALIPLFVHLPTPDTIRDLPVTRHTVGAQFVLVNESIHLAAPKASLAG